VPPPALPPLNPGTVVATPGDGQVTLSVGAPPSGGSGGPYIYSLYRGLIEGALGTPLGVVELPHVDDDLANGVPWYYTPRVGDGISYADAPQVGPVTPVENEYAPADIARHTLEDGTLGTAETLGWVNPWGYNIDVVDDPTGAGRGKVARFRYRSADDGYSSNKGLYPIVSAAFGLGETRYFRGSFYLPEPPAPLGDASTNRKLVYVLGTNSNNDCNVVVRSFDGNILSVEYLHNLEATVAGGLAALEWNRWYRLYIMVQANSTAAASDGELRICLDGVQVLHATGRRFITNAAHRFTSIAHGYQIQRSPFDTFDENRYWDDVNVSSLPLEP
jgi:hypothetical protein